MFLPAAKGSARTLLGPTFFRTFFGLFWELNNSSELKSQNYSIQHFSTFQAISHPPTWHSSAHDYS